MQQFLSPRVAPALLAGAAVPAARADAISHSRSRRRPVWRHRMFTNFAADSERMNTGRIVQKLPDVVAEPGEKEY